MSTKNVEKAFNLFFFTETEVIKELGAVVHEIAGNDSGIVDFLRRAVSQDYLRCKRYPIPKRLHKLNSDGSLNYSSYIALSRVGRDLELFEDIFIEHNASATPLCCVTPIVQGIPAIDIITDHSPFMYGDYQGHPKIGPGVMKDYLQEYMTPNGFDLPKLIHNDYFNAIKLLFNQKYYVSCMKLLASFIDTVAFLEYGDMKGNFIKWLDSFATLHKIGISSSQLWELRNSILHMSNLDSRKVIAGKEKRISFCVAKEGFRIPENQGVEYFNLKDLIGTIADALSVWIKTFNKNPDKFVNFIERYDTIISDDRHSVLQI